MSANLNSNPEVLLRKRRNADRIRLERQEKVKQRQILREKQKRDNKNKFLRFENIAATALASERETERVKRISTVEIKKSMNDVSNLGSVSDFILKITEKTPEQILEEQESGITIEGEEDNLIREKIRYNNEETLIFVVRVDGPLLAKAPQKVQKILTILRLTEKNTGVFVILNKLVFPLLKMIAPYVVIGKPSLSTVRSLIQKRSRILVKDEENPHSANSMKEVILNDNNVIEEQLGSEGIICMEDIIHQIDKMGDKFQTCSFFLQPFRLNQEVSGFSALSKLRRIQVAESQDKLRFKSNSSSAPITEVDIDALIGKMN
ncbi:hypothetical protein TPHA_0B03740 [Tetrapisispora phaffii CBS 4417]|uniref:Ribosome biogenesis protein RLP7 n=1 Tax=Tetrapisispora phaffii (strain ATCC 24235 / CBS 4417 / NBRC 1672 / NRRL Y-8282 / UCD 70-5) TaxID=1071381 RepID=G8BPW5_TETPH|nr:hypothetical protein TPHA_0B03740 [Tetrapisispora phaffii CBS 4417]CCE62046.1 hypothetical protein TPHA_0B03740 [Tetrapisispora phaffii CBS 4417]